ncbi:uncharacterized protein LOC62_03G003601 [Vanrija pseudolonga]|uniref:Uncharacterized protein n=1 Tax=Vanrija pseudolonga TaxID=143232 RepID=A0AAF0Y4P8_9TREE|nr:hypothetical protein LOC62_03G003601 [Vanrija pseudolonga]
MAIIEEVPDSPPAQRQDEPIIEDVTDANATTSTLLVEPVRANSAQELASTLKALSARLALPDDLLPSYLNEPRPDLAEEYRAHAEQLLRHIHSGTEHPLWPAVPLPEQSDILSDVVRLHGVDVWTSPALVSLVDAIAAGTNNTPEVACHILEHNLRPLFSPHPHLADTRARQRAAGGDGAMGDMHESQAFKSAQGWGSHNALRWCAVSLPGSLLDRRLGLVLPPTLVLMDDWEPAWRDRGAWVLSGWVGAIPADELRRRGLDALFVKSLVHSLSLHSAPLPHVLPVTLSLVAHLDSKARADALSDIVDKALVSGWAYAPSGAEGRAVLINVAATLETLCGVLGTGIARWLKSIVPALLEPLQYSPSSAQLPHFEANAHALLVLLRTLRSTGRVARWRGQILDVLSRLWVQIRERDFGLDGPEAIDSSLRIQGLVRDVFAEVGAEVPSVRSTEFATLLSLNATVFAPLVAPTGA